MYLLGTLSENRYLVPVSCFKGMHESIVTWYLVPGTWYLVPGTAAAAAAAAGLADRGRTVLPTGTQQVFGNQVPGTLLVPGTRYRTPYVQDCCYCSGTVNHHSFRIV